VPLQPGTHLGSFEILAPIGSGGMGDVYRARDTKLGRDVALKVLPAAMASSQERLERFRREAKALASLDHPGIVTIYSVEESEGLHFLIMQLVEGQRLDRLIPEGGMAIEKLFTIATGLAGALAAAHERDIVHRDFKPANVMVTKEGQVKVLDFGLAKVGVSGDEARVRSEVETEIQTREGIVMGTMPYMSPEQVEGRAIDDRTDVFSLGVVLHEMATGSRPFRGDSAAALLSAILRDHPPPVTDVRPDLPGELARLIDRCLDKDRERRLQTAEEVRSQLEELWHRVDSGETASRSTAPAPFSYGFGDRPAVAVLPFENRSGDPEQEYFADGLAEDLITRLSQWRSFPVIARNSSFVYKGRAVDAKRVAADLGVRYVVEGSVRKGGSRVRIVARLTDATSGESVWAKTYDRELDDVFAVQDEISEAIATELAGDLQRAEHERAQRRPPENLEAWGLYQRALPLLLRFTREDNDRARALLERAITLDGRFAPALARLVQLEVFEIVFAWKDADEETLGTLLAQARRAIDADPREPLAHMSLSFVLMAANKEEALEAARRALDLNPSMPEALCAYAYLMLMTGHSPDESIAIVKRAMRLSPRDPAEWMYHDVLAGAYLFDERFAEGLAAARRLNAIVPGYYFGYLWCAMNAAGLGRFEEARDFVRQAQQFVPDLSAAIVRRCLGAMAPEVDRRITTALRESGLS
jgi:serine/threonine-protein kinase